MVDQANGRMAGLIVLKFSGGQAGGWLNKISPDQPEPTDILPIFTGGFS